MTREEAIEQLNMMYVSFSMCERDNKFCLQNEAVTMAINALKDDAKECYDCVNSRTRNTELPCALCSRNPLQRDLWKERSVKND